MFVHVIYVRSQTAQFDILNISVFKWTLLRISNIVALLAFKTAWYKYHIQEAHGTCLSDEVTWMFVPILRKENHLCGDVVGLQFIKDVALCIEVV